MLILSADRFAFRGTGRKSPLRFYRRFSLFPNRKRRPLSCPPLRQGRVMFPPERANGSSPLEAGSRAGRHRCEAWGKSGIEIESQKNGKIGLFLGEG